MPAYLVELDDGARFTLPQGADKMIVFAEDAADAKAFAKAQFTGDSNAAWDGATVTEIAAAADLEGFRLRIVIADADPVVDVTVTGASSATVDAIGALMETALNATSGISGAAYTAGTNTLVIAAGSGTDDLGDLTVTVEFLAPSTVAGADAAPIPGFVGTITDGGSATDDLSVVLVDAANPAFYAALKS